MLLLYIFYLYIAFSIFLAGFTGIPSRSFAQQQSAHSLLAVSCIFFMSQLRFCVPFVLRAGVLIIHPRSETSPAGF